MYDARSIVVVAFVALLALMPGSGSAEERKAAFDHARLRRQELERHIRPGYQRFADAAREFAAAAPVHCGDKTDASRKKLTDAFDNLVSGWGQVEHIAFGPVTAHQRLERIMFWPDRRGIGARQIANALRERDPSALDPKSLSQKSVAIQGLPALDAILFADGGIGAEKDVEALRYRCAFAVAIGENLSRIAGEIAHEWSEEASFAKYWLSPGAGNPYFLKPEETTIALAKAFDLGLEKVRDQYLGAPLGLNAQRRKQAPVLGRSGRAIRLVVARIAGLRNLYEEGGLEQALLETKSDDPVNTVEFARLVAKELETAEKGAKALMTEKAPFEGAAAGKIIALGFPLKNARTTAAGLLSTVTDLPLGFNASDGD